MTLTGMVLTSMKVGEYDKRISLLTREAGKVSAFVRGAARAKSPMLAVANPMAFGTFEAYVGKDSYTIAKADISHYFDDIKTDYDMVWYASYFLEIAEYYGREGIDETERLQLLYLAMRALEKKLMDVRLIRSVYELKTMTINGDAPNLFPCISCGKEEDVSFFSMNKRGCVCKECYEKEGGEPLQKSVLYAMHYIQSSPLEKLFSFNLKLFN